MNKNIVKLLRNLIVLSIPLLILSFVAYLMPLDYMAVEYTMWQEESDFVRSSAEQSKRILILGDSRAKSSYLPEQFGPDTYNMAIGGSTSIEMYYALKNYLKNHIAPQSVIVTFAPYHFCSIDNWQQTLYYNYLTPFELAEVEAEAFKYSDETIHYSGWLSDLVSFNLRLPNKYLDAMYQAKFTGNREANKEKYATVREHQGYTEFGTDAGNSDLNYETHHEEFDYSPLVLSYYYRLLDLCESNGIRVIIAQAPINEASSKVITDEFWNGYKEFLSEVQEKHPSFIIENEVPVYDNIYFGDNNHMNHAGADKFTQEFISKYLLELRKE